MTGLSAGISGLPLTRASGGWRRFGELEVVELVVSAAFSKRAGAVQADEEGQGRFPCVSVMRDPPTPTTKHHIVDTRSYLA